MLRNEHVRFGGRPAETHQEQPWQGAAGRPYTEHPTKEGTLYLCAVKDAFSNKIVGYWNRLAYEGQNSGVNALKMATTHRGNLRCVVVHSDRGSQLRSEKFLKELKRSKLHGSMGRVGPAGDNAAMEMLL